MSIKAKEVKMTDRGYGTNLEYFNELVKEKFDNVENIIDNMVITVKEGEPIG